MASQNYPPPSNSRSKTVDSGMAVSKDGHSVTKRLRQDLTTLMVRIYTNHPETLYVIFIFVQLSGDKSISAFPDNDNLFNWIATITGGTGTIYESQSYKLTMSFPGRYPYNPPVVKFLTPIFHPNVDEFGNICLDILKVRSI